MKQDPTPIQAVDRPILCSPYAEPALHWHYDRTTGEASKIPSRRPARYWYKTKDDVAGQLALELSEGQDDLHTINKLRKDVFKWRASNYEGVTPVTRELLNYWSSKDRPRRLFFCQLEAVETVIYLAEILKSGRRPRFNPEFLPADVATLVDTPANPDLLPLSRFGCKMATGSGKTVVMSMLIAWAFCNRGRNTADERFPGAVLICCPNLTVKERLQVLRPERADNYFVAFDIVPVKLRPLMQNGRVLVENWHSFAPQSEHTEGDKSYAVVNKGIETPEAFAKRVLGDLYDRMPIMVLNDEAHHCYRPAPLSDDLRKKLTPDQLKEAQSENEEATVWIEGLDKLNNHSGTGILPVSSVSSRQTPASSPTPTQGSSPSISIPHAQRAPGIALCIDLSATPFYIGGSGHIEGSPFPWLVSDFGLVDAIESGIVKIPRLPVSDTTGRPEPKYFRLWENIRARLQPAEFLPGKARKPKPESVFRAAEAALNQLAGQWVEKFRQIQESKPGQEIVPPVLILVCDNTDIAELFYQKISGERPLDAATEDDVAAVQADEDDAPSPAKRSKGKPKQLISRGNGVIFPEFFANTQTQRHTLRIDSELLAKAESDDPNQSRKEAGEALRKIIATVGKRGEPGEHVRCVVSVSMLTEGWDANNVTHIFGLRAFGTQLLCEQVVGRGLRRTNYTPDKDTGLLTEEYVDVYGIPFTVVPFKGRKSDEKVPDDKPKNHVKALDERINMEIRFPVVEGYAFALRKNLIRCDVAAMEKLTIEPNVEPTATFLQPTIGYQEGTPSQNGPFAFEEQNRDEYYQNTHPQAIKFQVAQLVVRRLRAGADGNSADAKARVMNLQSRHQLFPQVLHFVTQYIKDKVELSGAHPCELGLEKYVQRMVERFGDAIEPDDSQGEPPLLPVLNRYKPMGTSSEVEFVTTRACRGTQKSHVNQVVLDTETWEASATFYLESSEVVSHYVRNDHLGLLIPYEFEAIDHSYEPDFIVVLKSGLHLVLEVKGETNSQVAAKHEAARKWCRAVNQPGNLGKWAFNVCYDPHQLPAQLAELAVQPA